MKIRKLEKLLLIFFLAFVTTSSIYAKKKIKKLNSITVTANKVEENIKDIAQSISILDEEIIEEKNINNISDVINEIPNMYINPRFGGAINFRGLNTTWHTFNNPVVIYIDGIASSDANVFDASIQNVERIEVLRGPQGTLYGKDAIGGVINIVTKKPSNETYGDLGFEYGSNNYLRGTFNINAPLIKNKLFFNLNAVTNSDDGWITNKYNNDDKAAKIKDKKFGTSILYKINDNLSTQLFLKKEKSKQYWGNYHAMTGAKSLNQFNRNSAKNSSFDKTALVDNNFDSQALKIKYESDKFIFESVSTHKKNDFDSQFDLDFQSGTPYDGYNMIRNIDTKTYTQELRISNKPDENIRWIGGLYYEKEDSKYDYSNNRIFNFDSNTKAIFAQTMIPINNKLELTIAGRFQEIKKEKDLNKQKKWNTFLPKIGLSYKLNNNFTPFISISKGYMPGGFNTNGDKGSFKPQKSTNYEMGIKGAFENLMFTASIFRMNIEDIHIYKQIAGNYSTDNADKAHTQGIEFDLTYFPTDTLEISGAFGFMKSKYDSYNAGDYNFSGEKIEQTPSHTLNLGISYHHPKGFYSRVDIKNQGSVYFYDDLQKKFLKNDSFITLNAKIGYKYNNLNIYAYGENLTDEEYLTYYQSNALVSLATFGDQRTFGFGFKYKF